VRCVLHIGTEKTATTTLQEFLYKNRDRLWDLGIGMSSALGVPNNRKMCAYFQKNFDDYFFHRGLHDPSQRKTHFAGMLDSLKEEIDDLESNNGKVFVITSEHFHSRLLETSEIMHLRDGLAEIFTETSILCYFREQSELVRSLYSTAIRVGHDTPFRDFAKTANPDNHYYNYFEFFSKWSEVFGQDRVNAMIFDRKKFCDGDIRKDFLLRLDQELDLNLLDYSGRVANEQLARAQVVLGRRLNQTLRAHWIGSVGRCRLLRLRDWITESRTFAVGRFRNPYAEQIFEAFEQSNREFAKAFLDLDRNPFEHPVAHFRERFR
jgi:hypothetical protein